MNCLISIRARKEVILWAKNDPEFTPMQIFYGLVKTDMANSSLSKEKAKGILKNILEILGKTKNKNTNK